MVKLSGDLNGICRSQGVKTSGKRFKCKKMSKLAQIFSVKSMNHVSLCMLKVSINTCLFTKCLGQNMEITRFTGKKISVEGNYFAKS